MRVQQILSAKGSDVYCIDPQSSLADVVSQLVSHNCGSLLVMDHGKVVGIITERDILRTVASEHRGLAKIRVGEKMSCNLIRGHADQDVAEIMGILTENRIRHLPIFDGDELTGMISIGDVVKAQHARLAQENHYLKRYIQS